MVNEPSDLTAIVFDGVDKIQHLAYRLLDPSLIPANPTSWEAQVIARCWDYFTQIDEFLGRTQQMVGDLGRIFIASDHGFTASTEIVYINRFLHDQGWLTWKEQVDEDDNETIYTDRLQDHIALMDIPRTKAFALTPSCNGIFINVAQDEYSSFREQLIAKLYEIKGPDGGQVVTEVLKREDCFSGPYMHHAPDLTLTLRDFGLVSVLNGPSAVVSRSQPWGTHHPEGVLMACGKGIRRGIAVETRDILDVPSLLAHSIGLDIPSEYEGQFVDSFYEPSYLASDPPRVSEAATLSPQASAIDDTAKMDDEEEALVLQRLKSLGYIE